MDRVIPKDVVDLIYKESYYYKIKRLNAEYHELFHIYETGYGNEEILLYENKHCSFRFRINDRDLH